MSAIINTIYVFSLSGFIHKLRSIVECDKIVVLKEGHLVEEGTHNELLRQSGLYHRLYSLQNESMDWTVKAQI